MLTEYAYEMRLRGGAVALVCAQCQDSASVRRMLEDAMFGTDDAVPCAQPCRRLSPLESGMRRRRSVSAPADVASPR